MDGSLTVTSPSRRALALRRVFSVRLLLVVGSWRLRQRFCNSGVYSYFKSSGSEKGKELFAPFMFGRFETLRTQEREERILVFGIVERRKCFKQPFIAQRDSQTNTPQDFQFESALFSLSYFFVYSRHTLGVIQK